MRNKEDIISAAIGIALSIPLVLCAVNSNEQKTKIQKEKNAVVVEIPETTSSEAETTLCIQAAVEDATEVLIKCAWADIELSMDDYNLLCATVYCETGHQDIKTQILAALCI